MAKSRRRRRKSAVVDDNSKNLTTEEKFRIEYAYVLRDLRTVFIIAGAMFALLITINLILQ